MDKQLPVWAVITSLNLSNPPPPPPSAAATSLKTCNFFSLSLHHHICVMTYMIYNSLSVCRPVEELAQASILPDESKICSLPDENKISGAF